MNPEQVYRSYREYMRILDPSMTEFDIQEAYACLLGLRFPSGDPSLTIEDRIAEIDREFTAAFARRNQ